jgi:DNA invertase Pin-like site-specific DNA recombinase
MTTPRRRLKAPALTAAAYIRVSTDEQAASGAGLEAQRSTITAEAERRGWTITGWYADEGVSGSKAAIDRAAAGDALRAVRSGEAAALIVAKLDRLGRSVYDLAGLMQMSEREGWQLTACDGTVDTSTPQGRFHTHIMAGVAELERGLIGQRTKDALAARRAAGVRLGRPSVLDRSVVERIVGERDAGASLRAIAEGLTANGVQTARGGGRWSTSSIQAILAGQDAARIRLAASRSAS